MKGVIMSDYGYDYDEELEYIECDHDCDEEDVETSEFEWQYVSD
jgi:hypothetical protein